jgi:acetyl esterase/lipase
LPVKRLFVRDLRQSWYHQGLPPEGHTLLDVAGSLRALIAEHEVERLVFTGNSAGGYAALAFGTLLGAEQVLCFAPQTILDLEVLDAMGDHRWDQSLRKVVSADGLDPNWIDLSSALPAARHTDTRYSVFFDDSLTADRLHAERLLGIEGMRLYRFGRGAHHLVRSLRDSGALEQLLRRALAAPVS